MITVNTHEAKTRLSSLIASVEKHNEIVLICRNGHPVAEIHSIFKVKKKELPKPDKKLAAVIKYEPTEPLDDKDMPECYL